MSVVLICSRQRKNWAAQSPLISWKLQRWIGAYEALSILSGSLLSNNMACLLLLGLMNILSPFLSQQLVSLLFLQTMCMNTFIQCNECSAHDGIRLWTTLIFSVWLSRLLADTSHKNYIIKQLIWLANVVAAWTFQDHNLLLRDIFLFSSGSSNRTVWAACVFSLVLAMR